jgi:glycosyltransferase involved in cell wall biosynthesis
VKTIKENICITASVFPTLGGATAMIHEYWKALRVKNNVHFISFPILPHDQYDIHPIAKKRISSFTFPLCYIYTIAGLYRLIKIHRKYKFKAIIPQEGSYTALYSGIFGKITGVKVILMDFGHAVNVYNDEYWQGEGMKQDAFYRIHPVIFHIHLFLYRLSTKAVIRFAARLMDNVMIIGVDLDELYRERLKVPAEKIRYYELGIDEIRFSKGSEAELEATRKKYNVPDDVVVISWAGRISHEKGIDYFLTAAERVLEEKKNIIILIAGGGNMEPVIQEFIQKKSLEHYIRLVGFVPLEEMPSFLSITDIFLYTATQGGTMSSGVLQAMSCECAVIATNHPRSHAKLLNGRNGIVIPPHDADLIYQSMMSLLNNPDALQKIKKEARAHILKYHSTESLQRYLDFI